MARRSAGATQFFTYDFDAHAADLRANGHLLTGEPAQTAVAVYCPTTLYRLGGDLQPTIQAATRLRACTAYDVLDELLIGDGALTDRYKALVLFQGDFIDQPILDRIQHWVESGGTLLCPAGLVPRNVAGDPWLLLSSHQTGHEFAVGRGRVALLLPTAKGSVHTEEIRQRLHGLPGIPDSLDGVWTTRRGHQRLFFNPTTRPARRPLGPTAGGATIEIAPGEIGIDPAAQ